MQFSNSEYIPPQSGLSTTSNEDNLLTRGQFLKHLINQYDLLRAKMNDLQRLMYDEFQVNSPGEAKAMWSTYDKQKRLLDVLDARYEPDN